MYSFNFWLENVLIVDIVKKTTMIPIKIRFPVNFMNAIDIEAQAQESTRSQYAEHMVRNGIAIFMMLDDFVNKKDRVGINICSSIIRIGINDLVDSDAKIRPTETFEMSYDPTQRWKEIEENFSKMEKYPTTVNFTDKLTEWLQVAADTVKQPLNLMIFMYIQASFVGWLYRSTRSENNPREDLEKMDKILEEIRGVYVIFNITEKGISINLKKRIKGKKSIKDKDLIGLITSPLVERLGTTNGKIQPQDRESGGYVF